MKPDCDISLPNRRPKLGRPCKYSWDSADCALSEALSKGYEPKSAGELARFLRINAVNEYGEAPTVKQTKFHAKRKYLQVYENAKAIREEHVKPSVRPVKRGNGGNGKNKYWALARAGGG